MGKIRNFFTTSHAALKDMPRVGGLLWQAVFVKPNKLPLRTPISLQMSLVFNDHI